MTAKIQILSALSTALLGVPASQYVVGLFAGNPLADIHLVRLNITDGSNTTLANLTLGAISQTFPAYLQLDTPSNTIYAACATSDAVYAISLDNYSSTPYAPLAKYDPTNDAFIGLQLVSGKLYLITQSGVSLVTSGAVMKLAKMALPFNAGCASAPTGGSNGAGLIFVADGDTNEIYTIDLGNLGAGATTVKSKVTNPWDIQWSSSQDTLIILGGYQLYSVNYRTGATTKIMNIVDGSGYPRVNTISPDGKTFVFLDFQRLHTIDIPSKTYTGEGLFSGAPRAVGFPVWIAA